MNLHVNKVPDIVTEFLMTRVVTKAPDSAMQFGFGFLVPYVAKSAQATVNNPLLKNLGVVTGDGLIDLDTARASANEALAKAGGKVTAYGISFDRSDIDALFEIANKYGG